MLIRIATFQEYLKIKSYARIVQSEASLGYLGEMSVIKNDMLPNGYYLVLVDDRMLKGWILVGEAPDPFTNQRIGYISELYVLAPFRHKGYGKYLMEKAVEDIKNRGLTKVQLNVFAGNKAKDLYEKMGFESVCTIMEKRI